MQAGEDGETFVYMGGDQEVPMGVRRVRIHKSVKVIPRRAFWLYLQLAQVEFHDEVEIIEENVFFGCISLRSIKLIGVKTVKKGAFTRCTHLTDVEFGDKLETIEVRAFMHCTKLTNVTMPSVGFIGSWAFTKCYELSDLELPEGLEKLESCAFACCSSLRGIALPLNIVIESTVFYDCTELERVDLIGGVHSTVASLHLETWRNEMKREFNRINQVLTNTNAARKTLQIQQWIRSVTHRLEHYKAEHQDVLKEATTLLELALWKVNLDENEGGNLERERVRLTRGRRKRARKEICVTSGASIVIKNVLPFLQLQ